MLTNHQINTVLDALTLAFNSNKRAMNTKRNPEFTPIYEKIERDILELQSILRTEQAKLSEKALPNKK